MQHTDQHIDCKTVFLICFFPENMLFQYFITVVPTKLHTSDVSVNMHQFSVTEQVGSRVFVHAFVHVCVADGHVACLIGACCKQ